MTIANALFPEGHWANSIAVTTPDQLRHSGAKLLILHGGEDIASSIYGKTPGHSHSHFQPSSRDKKEMALVKEAVSLDIPILGICRGAQLLCAMAGGNLWQDVSNHGDMHPLIYKGKERVTNSAHHQMMIPTENDQILAWAPCRSEKKYKDGSYMPQHCKGIEPEIVYFPKLKALGVQGHPEWLPHNADLNNITRELVQEKLNVTLECGASRR